MRTIYYTGTDNGDGSVGVSFYDDYRCIEALEEFSSETYRGEGGGSFNVEGELSNITIDTMEDVYEYLSDFHSITKEQVDAFIYGTD